jgi:large subunit ribosomal protein L13
VKKPTSLNIKSKAAWYLIDAENKILGRLSSEIAAYLRGKNKATFSPHLVCGDHIIVINAEKVKLTGQKEENKIYYSHTGYKGGIRATTPAEIRAKDPTKLIYKAVYGMLPDNRLRQEILKNLKIYVGNEHPHLGQNPIKLDI